jgi:hypothetical protein
MKTDRLHWLKSVDDSMKTKHKKLEKLQKNDNVVTQFRIGENVVTQPHFIF